MIWPWTLNHSVAWNDVKVHCQLLKAFNQQPKQVQLRAFALATSGRCHMCRSFFWGGFWDEETDWSKVPWLPWPFIGCKVTGYLPVANNFPGSFFWRGWMLQGQRPQLVKIFTEATQLQTNQACEGKSSEVHMFFYVFLHSICMPFAKLRCRWPLCSRFFLCPGLDVERWDMAELQDEWFADVACRICGYTARTCEVGVKTRWL